MGTVLRGGAQDYKEAVPQGATLLELTVFTREGGNSKQMHLKS